MSHSTHPMAVAAFSERTAEMDKKSMNNIAWNYTFRCPVCEQTKRTAGRVSRGYKRGFRCAECESKRINKAKSAA